MDRARRKQNKPVRFSPTPISSMRTRAKRQKTGVDSGIPLAGDILSDGSLFRCDKCGSTFLDSGMRGIRKKSNVVNPKPRYSSPGQALLYCKPCGREHDRLHSTTPLEVSTLKSSDNARDDESVKELESFIQSLASTTGIAEASKLACYNPSKRCHCLANYLMSANDLKSEVNSILEIWNKAAHLKTLKISTQPMGTRDRKVGLGNGKKRSKEYETFVLNERRKLREVLNLCEHTTQRILNYSNNFLHKSLLTEQKRTRVGDKSRSNLMPITVLWKHNCCHDSCTRMTRTHLNLVVKWRQLALESRRGLQQAVAELLTPTAGAKTNCYKFVTMVTGCSTATVAKVAKKIKKNGGVLGMHEHGLRKFWRLRREADADDEALSFDEEEFPCVWSLPQHHADEVELRQTVDKQNEELELMKTQLSEKQRRIDEQQTKLTALSKRVLSNTSLLKSPGTHHSWGSNSYHNTPTQSHHNTPTQSHHNTPTQSERGWGGNAASLTVDTGPYPSPQYPRRQGASSQSSNLLKSSSTNNATTQMLLHPSKLDTAWRLQRTKQQSNSYVVATAKPQSATLHYDQHQHSLHPMQYMYSSNTDLASASQSNPLLNQRLPTSAAADHFTNFGHVNTAYYNLSAAHTMFNGDLPAYSGSGDVSNAGLDGRLRMFSATQQTSQMWGYTSGNFPPDTRETGDIPSEFHSQ